MIKSKLKGSKLITKFNKSTFSKNETILLFVLISLFSTYFGFTISNLNNTKDEKMKQFINDFEHIEEDYYGDFDKENLLKKALETVINELDDPYSTVIDNSLSNSMNTNLQGSYKGVGIEVANTTENDIVIVGIINNSPASKTDLKVGDIVIKINSKDVAKNDTSKFVEEVKELKEDSFNLTILRNSEEKQIQISKELVVLDSTESRIIENNDKKIGYIYISIFAANTGEQFIENLEKLKKEKIDSLIIDVRNNSGGHLTAVEDILNNMIKKDKVIYQIESKSENTKIYSTGKNDFNLPICILMDQNSASGSEMLAISLKENLDAITIGKTTFGKGTVQEVQNTENTDINYKLTTKKWLSPKGNWIHSKGIKPDYTIELDKEYLINPSDQTDKQLQKALEILDKKDR